MTRFLCCCGKSDDDQEEVEKVERDETLVKQPDKCNFNNNDLTIDNSLRSSIRQELKSKLGIQEVGNDDENMISEPQRGTPHSSPQQHLNEDGLIIPRKPPNPVVDNSDRQNLHREMLFNHKIGKSVLNQKSELQRALAKHKDNIARKEQQNTSAEKTPEFKRIIADRAKRLEEINNTCQNEEDIGLNKEFLQARAKLKARNDSK